MINKVIENVEYKELVSSQVKKTIEFLLNENIEFAITANLDATEFNPELPSSILEQLSKYSLFVLSNYTYGTIELDEEYIYFEAGFGSENFGSTVKIPFFAIFQIVVDESILFVNSVATVDKFTKNPRENSLNIFRNNPKNKNLLD